MQLSEGAIVTVKQGIEVWYEYVPSACNWADAPSRDGESTAEVLAGWERLERFGSTEIAFVLPTEEQWKDPGSLLRA